MKSSGILLTFPGAKESLGDTDPIAESLVADCNALDARLKGRVRATKEAAVAVTEYAKLTASLLADLTNSNADHPPGVIAALDQWLQYISEIPRRYRRLANNTPDGGAA